MQTGHIKNMTAKVRKLIEIEEEQALIGTIKFGRSSVELEETGGRFSRKPNFAVPAPCSERPISVDGRVAFHFKHTFVVKKAMYASSTALKSATLVITGDSESFSTDAAEHDRYISREAAVMAIDAASYDQYIEQGGLEDRDTALFTNIHPELERRIAFWNALTRCERNPSPDVVTLHIEKLPAAQWDALLAPHQPDTPVGKISELYAAAVGPTSIECQLEFREFRKLRKQLVDMGAWDKNNPPITIKRGRGGRVQRRIVGEFPVGLSAAARIRITGRYVAWLGERGVMYTAVIHEPDHHNDCRNFHLHVAAYDRPCRYLEDKGCWDFEYREAVPGQYKRFRSPKRQNKLAAMTRPSNGREFRGHGAAVLTEMREKFASLCNEELTKLGINRLFDHRSYAAMGIRQEPGRHLGSKAASLEAAGVPTMLGIENAERSWQGAFDRARHDHDVRQRLRTDCRGHAREALDRLLESRLASPVVGELNNLITDFDRLENTIGDQEMELTELYLTLQMAYSRADKTADVCQRLIEAIESGGAPAAERDLEDEIRERLRQAEAHQDRVHAETLREVTRAGELAEELAVQVKKLETKMKEMRKAIDLAEELLAPGEKALPPRQLSADEPAKPHIRSRYSREIAAYFDAPLDYEDDWDRAFMRIQYEELEIKSPTASTPHYHVPGIAKADLDRLMNPIFEKRSQARLQAMHEFQELNRVRAAQRAVDRAVSEPEDRHEILTATRTENASPASIMLERSQPDRVVIQPPKTTPETAINPPVLEPARAKHYDQLQREAAAHHNQKQAEAIEDWMTWFRAEYDGRSLPARFEDGKLVLQLEQLPADRRQIADVFSEQVTELVMGDLDGEREVLRSVILGSNRVLVQLENNRAVYEKRDFLPELRPNLELLLQGDPVVRGYIEEASVEIPKRQPKGTAAAIQMPIATLATARTTSPVASAAGIHEEAWHLGGKGKSR